VILLAALVVSFVVGVLRGGTLARLVALPLRWPGVPVLAFAAQALLMWFPEPRLAGLSLHIGILMLSYLALLFTVWVNRRLPGMVVLGLGLVLNLTVMLANGGYMPITPQAMERIGHGDGAGIVPGTRVAGSKDVALPREQTNLWFLSDVLVLAAPFPIPSAFSVGDVCIALGAFVLVQHGLGVRPWVVPGAGRGAGRRAGAGGGSAGEGSVLKAEKPAGDICAAAAADGEGHVTARDGAVDRDGHRRAHVPRADAERQPEVGHRRL
jgi:hypothetical protein